MHDQRLPSGALAEGGFLIYDFFIKKREAYNSRDAIAFQKILDEEIQFLQDFDEMSLKY